MKKLIKISLWVVILGGLGFLAYNQLAKNKAKLEENTRLTQERNTDIPVITAQVSKAMLEGNFEVVGNFAPYKQVALMSEAAGKVRQLNFDNGTHVQAGATLALIDNDLLNIQLQTAKTNLAKAENDLQRLTNLLGEGGVTQQQLDDARLSIENLKQQIKLLEKQIAMSYVKAPISGVITNKMVEVGSLVAPAMALANITNISRLKMQVYLTEEQVVTVKKGQHISMQADLFPGKLFEGNITFIDVNAGPSRRYLVEIEINNSSETLKAGMTGTVFFEGGTNREVLAIPREAIVGSLQEAKVYLVENNKAILHPIEAGTVFGNKVQVRSGLTEGQVIVVSGQINLENGMNVQIAEN